MVEGGAADVVVNDRGPLRGFLGPFAIELGVEDGFDGAEGAGADGERALTGRLHPLASKASHEVYDATAGAEALLGMSLLAQDDLDECRGIRPDLGGLALDALGRPVGIAPVARRHVLGQGRVSAVGRTAPVRRDALATMEHLHCARGVAGPQLLAHERVRHRVVVLVDLHVIVDAGAALLPLRERILRIRKLFERGALDLLKQRTAARPEMAGDAIVDLLDAVANGSIELGEREERAFPELSDDPSGCDLDSNFYLRFILRFFVTCWDYCGVVMVRHLLIRTIDVRLVEAGFDDARFQIVADDHRRHTTKVAEGARMRADPIGERLRPGRFRISERASAK